MTVTSIDSRIKPGDIVRLKTGGPPLVVCRIVKHKEHKDDEAECYWWDIGVCQWGMSLIRANVPWGKMFPLPCLVKVKPKVHRQP
jgi:uncharacterized protein YodC (DUF2158 family)